MISPQVMTLPCLIVRTPRRISAFVRKLSAPIWSSGPHRPQFLGDPARSSLMRLSSRGFNGAFPTMGVPPVFVWLSYWTSGDKALAQVTLQHLAVGVARQRVVEPVEFLRDLVVGEHVGAVAREFAFLHLVAKHDKGVDSLAEHRTGLGDDRRLDDRGMIEEDVLDLGCEDLVAATVDDVLDAVDDPEVALLVHDAEIAGLP